MSESEKIIEQLETPTFQNVAVGIITRHKKNRLSKETLLELHNHFKKRRDEKDERYILEINLFTEGFYEAGIALENWKYKSE